MSAFPSKSGGYSRAARCVPKVVAAAEASKVARAANGWEALIKIGVAARPFDVVITDHRMPRMTGLQLVRRLRAKNFAGLLQLVKVKRFGYLPSSVIPSRWD
jgi:CheY-like chemotaxis protein